MLSHVPMVMMLVVLTATALRMAKVYRATGINPWVMGDRERSHWVADLGFAGSIAALALASTQGAGARVSMTAAAAMLSAAGALIVVVAQVQMGKAWRIGVRAGDAPLLIEHGLYRYSRNPIYVGILLVGLAVALASGLWWPWVAVGVFALSAQAQIKREEAHLTTSFGQSFTEFCRRVPRWL